MLPYPPHRLSQEQHSLQLFLGNPKHPKQLIINTLRDSVKAIPGHLEVSQVVSISRPRCPGVRVRPLRLVLFSPAANGSARCRVGFWALLSSVLFTTLCCSCTVPLYSLYS